MTQAVKLTRRASLLLPLALAGCGMFDWLSDEGGKPVRGNRERLLTPRRGLSPDAVNSVELPPLQTRAAWPQAGGDVNHIGGNLAGGLNQVWAESIGDGADYRNRLTAQPLIVGAQVFAMDIDGVITARDLATGKQSWEAETKAHKNKSTNVGGGIAYADGRLYAATGRGEALAIDPTDGHIIWRAKLPAPGRGAPLVVNKTLYICTIDAKLLAMPDKGGDPIWTYQASHADIGVLATASPAYADGLVVAGFESGDLAALRADTGTLVWSDNLGTLQGSAALIEFASIRGAPVIDNGLVYAIGLGGLFACLDLRSGRRVWERDVAGSNTPWLAGDTLFIIDSDQRAAAINKLDGSVYWVTQLQRYENSKKTKGLITWTGPVLIGGKLIAQSTAKHRVVMDPITGKIIANDKIDWNIYVSPVGAQGYVLMLADDGTLIAFK
jgi:outer membrane protein assembly factor BamB